MFKVSWHSSAAHSWLRGQRARCSWWSTLTHQVLAPGTQHQPAWTYGSPRGQSPQGVAVDFGPTQSGWLINQLGDGGTRRPQFYQGYKNRLSYCCHMISIYLLYALHIPCIYHVYQINLNCIYRKFRLDIHCICTVYLKYIVCISIAYTMHIQCISNKFKLYIQKISIGCTLYMPSI